MGIAINEEVGKLQYADDIGLFKSKLSRHLTSYRETSW